MTTRWRSQLQKSVRRHGCSAGLRLALPSNPLETQLTIVASISIFSAARQMSHWRYVTTSPARKERTLQFTAGDREIGRTAQINFELPPQHASGAEIVAESGGRRNQPQIVQCALDLGGE